MKTKLFLFITLFMATQSTALADDWDWTDGFIGARLSNSLAGKWQWVLRANVGAGGSDLALGMDLDFRRELASGNQFSLGFRALDVESNDLSGVVPVDLNTTFAGLTIGYTFNL